MPSRSVVPLKGSFMPPSYIRRMYVESGQKKFFVSDLGFDADSFDAKYGIAEHFRDLHESGMVSPYLIVYQGARTTQIKFDALGETDRELLVRGSIGTLNADAVVYRVMGMSRWEILRNKGLVLLGAKLDFSWDVAFDLTPMYLDILHRDNMRRLSLEQVSGMTFPDREFVVVDYLMDLLAEARASACHYANLTVEDGICSPDECDDVLSYAVDYETMPRWAGEVHGYGFSHQFPVLEDEPSDFDLN
jgi:hypothetical protein